MDIDLIVDHKVEQLELDMKIRHEVFFFYKEAMYFLVNNIQCKQIFVNFNRVKSRLLIELLSECQPGVEDFSARFRNVVQKRVNALPAFMDILADNKSFSVVLYVEL
jgi:hypothetical protein